MQRQTFDPIWEEKYRAGHKALYPWDAVVSFVFRNAPPDRRREDVHILEIGCGIASNLWFAAREGFCVAGIDGSSEAIKIAKGRFANEGLSGELVVGDFTEPLPFQNGRFDLAIDRGAVVCTGFSAAKRALSEVNRVLKRGGKFFFNPYSQAHTAYAGGRRAEDGLVRDILTGNLRNVGQLCFYSEDMVREAVATGWELEDLTHVEHRTLLRTGVSEHYRREVHAEWRVVARKTGPASHPDPLKEQSG